MPNGYKQVPKHRDNERFAREQDARRRRERSRSPVGIQNRVPRDTSRERPHDRESREDYRDSRPYQQPHRNGALSPTARTQPEAFATRLPPPPPPPVQPQPLSTKKPAVLYRSSLQAEIAKLAKDRLVDIQANSKLNEQDTEMPDAGGERKRKHEEVVWQPASKRLAVDSEPPQRSTPTPPKSIIDRTMQELADFHRTKQQLGYDSDAPAAVKSSPSFSGESGSPDEHRQRKTTAQDDEEEEGDLEGLPAASRWVTEDDDDTTVPTTTNGAQGASAAPKTKVEDYGEDEDEGELKEEAQGSQEHSRPGSHGAVAGAPEVTTADAAAATEPAPVDTGISMLAGCRSVDCFERIGKISEGTYGIVYKAREKNPREAGSEKLVALKRIKMEQERDGFPLTSIREINILLSLKHPNIVNVNEVVVGDDINSIYMVMEHLDHDLKDILEKQKRNNPFSPAECKQLMLQLLRGVHYMHDNWVVHRDLKTSNILYNSRGELKICDFGLARQYGSPLQAYTQRVVTLWYRAPELLLGQTLYSTAIDMWSVGCIMGELLLAEPLFNGENEMDQMARIFKGVGSPTEHNWPSYRTLPNASKISSPFFKGNLRDRVLKSTVGTARITISEKGWDLLSRLLELDPARRLTAKEALEHPWFAENPLPKAQPLMPTFAPRKVR